MNVLHNEEFLSMWEVSFIALEVSLIGGRKT